jgi:hypothetical protein
VSNKFLNVKISKKTPKVEKIFPKTSEVVSITRYLSRKHEKSPPEKQLEKVSKIDNTRG